MEEANASLHCCSVADLEEPAETAGMALAETVETAEAAVVEEFHRENQVADRIHC